LPKYPLIYFSKIKRIKTIVYVVKILENFWTGTYEKEYKAFLVHAILVVAAFGKKT